MRKTAEASTVKISRPRVSGVAPRARLFQLLDSGRKKPVIWIAGPAGSGKTTLVASYLDSRELPCLWYQVDEADGDIASFYYYMGLAAKKAAPRYRKPLPLLTPEYLAGIPTFTRRYFEELFRRLNPPVAVVFDNFQDASPTAFHEMISIALETIPEGINVMVLSRSAPPAELARLKANSKIALIGWNDLSFRLDECGEFLRSKGGRRLPEEAVRQLHDRTEGWAAGLVLMTEVAKTKDVRYSFISELSREAIFNYFASEIFDKTDTETRDFLLKTSFFPSMSVRAAEDLTGHAGARALLSKLSRNHYFTDWRPMPEPVYQYHPLFREFLQSHAKVVFPPEELTAVKHHTAAILEKEGRIDEAAVLYIDAAAWGYLIGLTLAHAQMLIMQGRNKTLDDWIRAVPEQTRDENAWLLYWLGICRLAYNPAEARGHFEKAYALFRIARERTGRLLLWAAIVNTFVYEWNSFAALDRWIAEFRDIRSEDPDLGPPEVSAQVAVGMFNALMWRQPQDPELPLWAERILAITLGADSTQMQMMLGNTIAVYYIWMGDISRAALVINALKPAGMAAGNNALVKLHWLVMYAMYSWSAGEHEACLDAVREGMQIAESSGIHLLDLMLVGQGIYSCNSRGDHAGAAGFLEGISAYASPLLIDLISYHYHTAITACFLGDFQKALHHSEKAMELADTAESPFTRAVTYAEHCFTAFEAGHLDAALSCLDKAEEYGHGMKRIEYSCLLLRAIMAFKEAREEAGASYLRRCFKIGAQQEYVNFSRWRPDVMSFLCGKALEYGIEVDYVRRLIRRRNLPLPENAQGIEAWPYPVRIRTFGKFELLIKDEPVQFSGKMQKKPLDMLKALIALGGKDISESRISDILWPDAEGDAAHKSLEMTLLRLRRLLGREDAVILQGGSLSLDPGVCRVDVQAFEQVAARAMEAWEKAAAGKSGKRFEEAVRMSEKSLGMYQGPFLPNDTGLDCTTTMREKLRITVLQVIGSLGGYWESQQQWKKAKACYRSGIEIDDIFEDFYLRLMVCHEKLGQRTEAIRVYERCRKALNSALGIEPSENTRTLYKRLRKDEG